MSKVNQAVAEYYDLVALGMSAADAAVEAVEAVTGSFAEYAKIYRELIELI